MLNAGKAADCAPSLTRITMFGKVPTLELVGVPVSEPEAMLNVPHEGMLVMLKLRVVPEGPLAVGVNEYAWPAVTCVGGVPLIVGGAGGGGPDCTTALELEPPLPPQPASAAPASAHSVYAAK